MPMIVVKAEAMPKIGRKISISILPPIWYAATALVENFINNLLKTNCPNAITTIDIDTGTPTLMISKAIYEEGEKSFSLNLT